MVFVLTNLLYVSYMDVHLNDFKSSCTEWTKNFTSYEPVKKLEIHSYYQICYITLI